METQHTPGPWRSEYTTNAPSPYRVMASERTKPVATIPERGNHAGDEFTEETQANALLIAAAPKLLEALENARIALTFYREWMSKEHSETNYPYGNDCEKKAREIIAKATGK